jgi:hypothetical protein
LYYIGGFSCAVDDEAATRKDNGRSVEKGKKKV